MRPRGIEFAIVHQVGNVQRELEAQEATEEIVGIAFVWRQRDTKAGVHHLPNVYEVTRRVENEVNRAAQRVLP